MPSSLPSGATTVTKMTTAASARHVAPHQFLRSGEQIGAVRDAGGLDAHQRRRAHDDQQHERGERQRNAVVETDGAGAPMQVGGQRMHCAVMPGGSAGTVCNSPQPGHSRSCGSVTSAIAVADSRYHSRSRPATSIVASPSASWPTAVLIAATSP